MARIVYLATFYIPELDLVGRGKSREDLREKALYEQQRIREEVRTVSRTVKKAIESRVLDV